MGEIVTPLQEFLDYNICESVGVKECRPYVAVMRCGMMFCHVVAIVFRARKPMDMELSLLCAILEPIVTHVDCFEAFLFDCVVCKPVAHGIVNLNWGWLL